MQIEKLGLYFILSALVLLVIGWIWLLVRAFRVHWYWGVGLLLVPPLALLFIPIHFRQVRPPIVLLLLGLIVGAIPYGVNYYHEHFVDLGPREKMVDGELHITLTGWDQKDYSIVHYRPRVVVLQMANADVDDHTLAYLDGLEQLRELDLNGTQIGDDGLAVLARLPRLEELRLARTKISDEGFQKHLAAKESLKKLDLTGTAVKGKTKRDWKKAQDGRDYVD
jgi:hypothetical protein